ncbi:TlpA disulfide reductase family protein [Parvicella tangerina]|uniref:Thiol-disulfide oxidoreductase ResA n=1 Tax=Parvicella tangerina TaxID=2829795 RepID=A0A916JJK4_9FLAO|nr:TlpA disulfide reductase family protein [Parvicella tangerina]CAG5077974.1 Thiol-disulfide oxidoreductase ResA [Parvicella tangerina]
MRIKSFALVSFTLLFWSCGDTTTTSEETSGTNNSDAPTEASDNSIPNTGSVDISGKIEGASGSTIYLYRYGVNPAELADSAQLADNGAFSFNTAQQGYSFVGVGFQANNAALLLVGSGDEIQLSGSADNWSRDYQVTGSGYSDDVRNYLLMRQEYTDKITLLKEELAATAKTDQATLEEINAQGMAMQEEFVAKRDNFIKEMDDTPALYIALQDIYDPVSDIDQLKKIGEATNKYMPNSMFSNQVNQLIQQAEQQLAYADQQASSQGALAIGKPAPELSFPTPEGKMLSLSSLKGKVVLLDFWASWCKPCRMENPNVVKLYNQYKDKGFTVYSVSLDNNKVKWTNAIQADGLSWPNHVSDLGGWNSAPAAIYGVNSIPQTYLIGEDGTIIAKDLRGEDLANKLKEILG